MNNDLYEEGCKNAERVASKFGYYTALCDDEVAEPEKPVSADCAHAKKAVSKYGITLVCE
ncbi:MAG: hypothetical protein Q4C56_03510 [Peptococcaceae bacterium]|nr:hypothetical protein [Peptococcaceae bacterium]